MRLQVRLKQSAYILRESEDIYQVVFTSTRRIKRFRVDNLTKDLINSVKLENNLDEIYKKMNERYNSSQVSLCLNALEKEGILERYDLEESDSRYIRQIAFINELTSSWDEAINLQRKIQDSTVGVFGVGGIGTWIVNGLHQIGVGKIRITDPDIVNVSNLNRQLFFSSEHIGKYKVEVIKEKLPDASISSWKRKVSSGENLEDIVVGCDFLVNCADSPSVAETTRVISKYAKRLGIPYSVAGGYNMHLGMIGPIIVPGKTACFDCFLDYQRINDPLKDMPMIKDLEQTGSLGPIAGAVANIQLMDIFKFLIGKGSVNFNRFAEIDFMNFNVEWREFEKRPTCECYQPQK